MHKLCHATEEEEEHANINIFMETPICFSQYFTNKQNVRSFVNVVKKRVLKGDCENFLKEIFEDGGFEHLNKHLTDELQGILIEVKSNLYNSSKHDFKQFFTADETTSTSLRAVDKEALFKDCWSVLLKIVPRTVFGCNHNVKIFRSLVRLVIFSMKQQHFLLRPFANKWDFSVIPWQNLEKLQSKQILCLVLIWIIKNILSTIISLNFYVTTCKIDSDENKLHFFWKHHWQRFYDKKISDMIFTKVIKKYEPLCLGRKAKKKHSLGDRMRLRSVKKDIPKLHLVLKSSNNYRPIVRYRNDAQNLAEKYKIKERLNFLNILSGKPQKRIETQFLELHQQWLRLNKPKLYFIKTDLSNAFGSVKREKLLRILTEKHLEYQNVEKSVFQKKKMAHQYKEMITELQRPLLVRAGSTIFEWNEGLVQGYKHSPALSEIYYSYMDKIIFSQHLKESETQTKLFVRVVDDYLYVTDLLDDAYSFLDRLSNYRNVNYGKTVVNFNHPSIECMKEITFLGNCYDTENLQVSRSSNVFFGQMCYKIAFSAAVSNVQKFLDNRIGQSGIQISSHIFNLFCNTEELLWKHIFTTFCISANKFCTILAILCQEQNMINYLVLYKKKVVVKLSNSMLDTVLRNKPADMKFYYCINHFHNLAWKALHLCAKGTSKCSVMIPQIKNESAKTNCLFGKWKEHASSINFNGECLRKSNIHICRKSELKMIVSQLDRLPPGFECYNHRHLNKTF